jgi:Kef-type K+ transport system membrane component KefB
MEFLPFFLILLAAVLFSSAFRRFHMPWVLPLLVAGMVIGPFGIGMVALSPTLEFMGSIGLVFLMFMAGLETRLSSIKDCSRDIMILGLLNGLVPLAAGISIGLLFGFEFVPSVLIGIIFMSSSVAVILPALKESGLIKKRFGKDLLGTTILVDIASLVLLSMLLQVVEQNSMLPLSSFSVLLVIVVIAFWYGLPKIRKLIPHHKDEKDLFESEVRIIFMMLLGTVATFELLGLHATIGGFLSGLVLSESVQSKLLIEKLRTMSYGLFIPLFFVVMGMQTDLLGRESEMVAYGLVLTMVLGAAVSKYVSGWLGARLVGFSRNESVLVGVATVSHLTTSLAVAYIAADHHLLGPEVITATVMLSMITTVASPYILRRYRQPLFSR